jgi:biotin carboxyl carrier protein
MLLCCLQDIADLILQGMDKLPYTELVDAASGFADLGFFPGVQWMDAHESNLNRYLDQLTTLQINLVKHAYLQLEQQQLLQQRLLHPEQLALLQQQQRAAAAAAAAAASAASAAAAAPAGSVRRQAAAAAGPGEVWRSRISNGQLAQSAAAAAAATAAELMGLDAASLGEKQCSVHCTKSTALQVLHMFACMSVTPCAVIR